MRVGPFIAAVVIVLYAGSLIALQRRYQPVVRSTFVCQNCTALRHEQEYVVPLTRLVLWTHRDPASGNVLSDSLAQVSSACQTGHRWRYASGFGNGVGCSLGQGGKSRLTNDGLAEPLSELLVHLKNHGPPEALAWLVQTAHEAVQEGWIMEFLLEWIQVQEDTGYVRPQQLDEPAELQIWWNTQGAALRQHFLKRRATYAQHSRK